MVYLSAILDTLLLLLQSIDNLYVLDQIHLKELKKKRERHWKRLTLKLQQNWKMHTLLLGLRGNRGVMFCLAFLLLHDFISTVPDQFQYGCCIFTS
jgi:hypothetical protein